MRRLQVASEAIAARLGVQRGALVQSVLPGSAAEKAGILATRRGLPGIVRGDVVIGVRACVCDGVCDCVCVCVCVCVRLCV